jgi:hypothetical protein
MAQVVPVDVDVIYARRGWKSKDMLVRCNVKASGCSVPNTSHSPSEPRADVMLSNHTAKWSIMSEISADHSTAVAQKW